MSILVAGMVDIASEVYGCDLACIEVVEHNLVPLVLIQNIDHFTIDINSSESFVVAFLFFELKLVSVHEALTVY